MFYKTHIKQFFDKVSTILGLLALAPVLLLICIVNLLLYKKIFFVQERSGYKMQSFRLIKFQTMVDSHDHGLDNDMNRITKFGKFLRMTSLDELPQLVNVIKGDMSLIGPRPLLLHYNTLYTEEQKQRFDAMPGLTGWAQVQGRNKLDWGKRFDMDNFYVQNLSFRLDILILVKTFFQLVKIHEVNASSEFTMKPFKN